MPNSLQHFQHYDSARESIICIKFPTKRFKEMPKVNKYFQ